MLARIRAWYLGTFCKHHPTSRPDVLVVTRSDLFPTDHGAAVKIIRTAESVSRCERRVFLCTDNRRHYYCFDHGSMTTLDYPLWVRLLALPRRLALLRLLLAGFPWSNAFLYFALRDFSYVVRSLYLATRYGTGSSLAEFPAYVQPLLMVRKLLGGKIVLVEHNVEYARLRAQLPALTTGGYQRLKQVELKMCQQADQIITVSTNDREILINDGIEHSKIRVIPHGVDLRAFNAAQAAPIRARYDLDADTLILVYHGTYSYGPNRQAIQMLASTILPMLEARGCKVAVLAIGSRPPADLRHPLIHFTGSVPDIAPLLKSADLAVVPLLEGGGTRMKILDYFAAGVPVISTVKGIEGIPVEHGMQALVLDAPEAICDAILRLRDNPLEARILADNAAAFVGSMSWDALSRLYIPLLGN